ncbi:uncharacterized protein LOC120718415 isoform X2 [Simochromis diagramma]|uniref:uncharacterized protein LOC120718415 isoform X2 n=1 Tax=Simochromis diagramma TaxID=43689 RepID=UPI001A7EC2A3|nr:uncharacterized protein LOC120718415 isoform X2 [Simochromis diagramma]
MLVSIRPASAEAAMSSAQYLREFIKERLTAVCEEIFSEVQKTIVQYEEEINRQHRLLDISRKPDRNSHIIEGEGIHSNGSEAYQENHYMGTTLQSS